jgi:MSHA pilin protein MshB
MKSLNIQNQHKASQSGFTIIELVVVILLLGILAATALPRFIDVTDEAHEAVVTALQGGLVTAGALYHAEWIAEGGRGSSVTSFVGVPASTGNGYPELLSNAGCTTAFDNMLQSGHPGVESGSDVVDNITTLASTSVDPASNSGFTVTPEIVSFFLTDTSECAFVYTADITSAADLNGSNAKYILLTSGGDTSRAIL